MSPYFRYLASWAISWTAITLLAQAPVICQMAHAEALGSAIDGCFQNPPRHPMSFTRALLDTAVPQIYFSGGYALFLALLSLAIHCLLLRIWRRSRFEFSANVGLRALVKNGAISGLVETLFFGIPFAIVLYVTADMWLGGDDCPYAYANHFFLAVESGGLSISFLAACVIAAVCAGRGLSRLASREAPEP